MFEKEAEKKYFNHKFSDFQGFYNRHYYYLGYLDSAEPREKRIAELEKENAELKDKLEILIAVGNTCTKGLSKQLIKAKEILRKFLDAKSIEETCVAESEAEQFLKESE